MADGNSKSWSGGRHRYVSGLAGITRWRGVRLQGTGCRLAERKRMRNLADPNCIIGNAGFKPRALSFLVLRWMKLLLSTHSSIALRVIRWKNLTADMTCCVVMPPIMYDRLPFITRPALCTSSSSLQQRGRGHRRVSPDFRNQKLTGSKNPPFSDPRRDCSNSSISRRSLPTH
jgi:hypothetical protein